MIKITNVALQVNDKASWQQRNITKHDSIRDTSQIRHHPQIKVSTLAFGILTSLSATPIGVTA